ncbi:MAG: hypothetical protein AAFV07_12140, partial [Bacteroidota bacterium]
FYTLLVSLVCLSSSSWAQNPMFIPFGQTKGDVMEFLASRDYVRDQDSSEAHRLTQMVSFRQKVHYLFKEGVLYSIEDERYYDNREVADRVIKSCTDYLSQGKKKLRLLSNQGGISRYAAVESDRLIELIIKHEGRRKHRITTIHLRATSRWHGPRMETENLVAEIVNQ